MLFIPKLKGISEQVKPQTGVAPQTLPPDTYVSSFCCFIQLATARNIISSVNSQKAQLITENLLFTHTSAVTPQHLHIH